MIPDLVAAIPDRIPAQFDDAAPGHRFHLYFTHWEAGRFTPYKDARLPDIKHLEKPERERIRTEFEARKRRALGNVCPLGEAAKAQVAALRTRQQSLLSQCGTNAYSIRTTSTSPFATGLGNEHPIENGFAFLTPYGLPYLAGSGVKGILRRAMQELRNDGKEGFTDDAINALFGPEKIDKPEDAQRGALDFWDVFPNPAGGKLTVEIMTPHYGGYYQNGDTPHDSGAPVPVSFLAVPAKSQFDFHVVCQPGRLPESLKDQWRTLLDRAFSHAFEWVGFGAKTSVGYGAMQPASMSATPSDSSSSSAAINSQGIASNITNATETWPAARIKFNRANGTLTAENNGAQAHAIAPQGEALLNALPPAIQAKIRRNEFVKVKVSVTGNTLVKLEA